MARPKNKIELIQQSNANFEKLMNHVERFYKEKGDPEFPPGTMNRNMRDVLAHLYEWHNMLLLWYKVGMAGQKPSMPKEGYTWKTVPELNREIWNFYKEVEFELIKDKLQTSHKRVMHLIDNHTNEELFTKKLYKWTGSTSLGAYIISATSSHYDWAFKFIKRCTK